MSAAIDFSDFDLDFADWTPEQLDPILEMPRDFDLDWRRFEIIDGALVVTPPPMPRHEAAVIRLGVALVPVAPADCVVLAAARVGVRRSYVVTDVTVVTSDGYGSPASSLRGDQVLLAVEIESPSSTTSDRVLKPALYAAAGVAHYWRVETDPLRLVTYRLAGDVYVESGSWGADEVARIVDPFPVEFSVGSLLPSG